MATKELVIDLSKYPGPESVEFERMTPDEFDKADLYGNFVIEATSRQSGQWFLSQMTCEQPQGDYRDDWCDGDVELIRYDVPKEVRWRCKECGDHGKIINFEESFWDFSNLPDEEKKRRYEIINGPDLDNDIDPFDILENLNEKETMDFLGAMDQYMKGIGGDMTREFGGLNTQQVYQLLGSDWTQPGSMIYLNDNLPLEVVDQSLFLHNARAFLTLLKKDGKFGATKELGNLTRKSVAKLIEVCRWPNGYLEDVKRMNKVIDEDDIWLLKNLRVLLDLAGLIHKRKDAFYLTKKNSDLMEESWAGKLYQLLFSTVFRKMNLAFFSGIADELPSLQDSTPYVLYRLHREAKKWISSDKLAERVLLATAYEELDLMSSYSTIGKQLYYYMLLPLEYFGIIESRYSGGTPDFFSSPPNEFRITPLFEQFITLNVEHPKSAGNVIPISENIETPNKSSSGKAGKVVGRDKTIYQLKISLNHIKPEIWRRILVPSDMMLPDLHKVIQTAMGWSNSHLHQFIKNRHFYNNPDYDDWNDANETDYRNVRISDLLKKTKQNMLYEYDFGDGWEHNIVLEKILSPDPNATYPVCIGGARNCPPEDCGGPLGYINMLEAVNDPGHDEHEIYQEWLLEDFDPENFNKDEVNALLNRKNYGCLEL